MRIVRDLGFCLLALMLAPVSILYAQNTTISPADAAVGVGQIVQFSVQATGLSSVGVTWSVAGVKGGNPRAGPITSAGIYTAPGYLFLIHKPRLNLLHPRWRF